MVHENSCLELLTRIFTMSNISSIDEVEQHSLRDLSIFEDLLMCMVGNMWLLSMQTDNMISRILINLSKHLKPTKIWMSYFDLDLSKKRTPMFHLYVK
jgi:hypothetical protein